MKKPPIGTRVRVTIADFERYAFGAAKCLHGLTGTVERYKSYSFQQEVADPDCILVTFDAPATTWHAYQTPWTSAWFPPSELEILP